ncbi:MAG: c-type cytochrome [Alphaproteobacteria bacterium]|nr:c-type cytochrome [Alphaproteobacteria bacterium]
MRTISSTMAWTLAVASLTLAACGDGLDRADADNVEAVALGQTLYGQHCAECHGAALQGQPNWRTPQEDGTLPAPPHNDTGHTWHHPDSYLFGYTKLGGQAMIPADYKSAMPAFQDKLKDADIWAVLSYIKSRWSDNSRMRQERLNRQG